MKCEIRDVGSRVIATGYREGSLYYLDHSDFVHRACSSSDQTESKCKLTVWHRRFGHLGASGMRELAKNKMDNGLQYDWKQDLAFCECCVQGKSPQLSFPQTTAKRASHTQ